MFCPACGAKNSTDQNFCRTCGMNLEPAARSLMEQFPAGPKADLDRRELAIEKFGSWAWGGFLVVFFIAILGLLYAIFDRFIFSGNNPLVGIVIAAVVISSMLMLAYVFLREDLKEKRKRVTPADGPPQLEMPVTTGPLLEEKEFTPIPTVTESTTDLLPIDKTRKF